MNDKPISLTQNYSMDNVNKDIDAFTYQQLLSTSQEQICKGLEKKKALGKMSLLLLLHLKFLTIMNNPALLIPKSPCFLSLMKRFS